MNDGSEAEALLETIEAELKVHTAIEEEILLPRLPRGGEPEEDDAKLYYEAVEEHHVVDMVLPEIDKGEVGSPEFAAKAKVLKDLVEHHAGEEEKEMFPRARKLMDKDELQTLGEQLARRKRELKAGCGRRVRGAPGRRRGRGGPSEAPSDEDGEWAARVCSRMALLAASPRSPRSP